MDLGNIITRFQANARAVEAIVNGLDDELARRRPDPDRWSVVEIIAHLADEEREDFRCRIDYTLHRPDDPWPPIDPAGRVDSLGFNQRTLDDVLSDFLAERERSIVWLTNLGNPDWNRGREHPIAGRLTAGDLLASWLAHDLLHIRQIARTLWDHLPLLSPGCRVDYAGPAPV